MVFWCLFAFWIMITVIAGEWSLDAVQWQAVGGTYSGLYISGTNVCTNSPITTTSDIADGTWILEPIDTQSDNWGFIIKRTAESGDTCAWYLDDINYNQIRAFALATTYTDYHHFIVEPVHWWNATFRIKNMNSDGYLYFNNVGRLKGNGDLTSAQGM